MQIHFSDFFNVPSVDIDEYGAFDISLINYLPLFIDPFLLFNSPSAEYKKLHDDIIRYLSFLKDMSTSSKINEGLLNSWYIFSEVKQNWLGYSRIGNAGSGLGISFARSLNINLNNVFANFGNEDISSSSHLEKLCLFNSGVGRDNISDFTTNLIKKYLLEYTEKFAIEYLSKLQRKKTAINKVEFNYNTRTWTNGIYTLPWANNDFIILTPKDILTKDDTWINKNDIINNFSQIAHSIPNQQLIAQINDYLMRQLPNNSSKGNYKNAVALTTLKFPQILDYYIKYKEDNGDNAVSLSKSKVKQIEQIFKYNLAAFTSQLFNLTDFYNLSNLDTYAETKLRIEFLKDVIENKGGHRVFYNNNKPITNETDLHILFRLTWFATTSNVSREVNNGRGPVDFEISKGAFDKTLVEFKLAKNTKLKQNLKKQVEIYKKASGTNKAFKVIVYFTQKEYERVINILKELNFLEHDNIFLIDARNDNKPSGSNA